MRVGSVASAAISSLGLLLGAFGGPSEARSGNPGRTFDVETVLAEKAASPRREAAPSAGVRGAGGDDVGSATEIPAIPYEDAGNTCAFADDYDAVCPFTGSTSPDVVYRFTPAEDCSITVTLCPSEYDTKLYVFENVVENVIACNDDACGIDGWKSMIECLPLVAGNTYFLVVDGFFGDCGEYRLSVENCVHSVRCVVGSDLEGEPKCHDGYADAYNAGCESDPPSFCSLCPFAGFPTTVCGTYGGFLDFGRSYRDTDWYRLSNDFAGDVEVCVTGDYATALGIIDGDGGCPIGGFYDYAISAPLERVCLTHPLPYGEWWIFVATSGFGPAAGPCPGTYLLTVDAGVCIPLPVESASWGAIKNLYR